MLYNHTDDSHYAIMCMQGDIEKFETHGYWNLRYISSMTRKVSCKKYNTYTVYMYIYIYIFFFTRILKLLE